MSSMYSLAYLIFKPAETLTSGESSSFASRDQTLHIHNIKYVSISRDISKRNFIRSLFNTCGCCDKSCWVDSAWLLYVDVVLLRDYRSLSLRYSAVTLAVGAI